MKKIKIILFLTITVILLLIKPSLANVEKFTMEELKENIIKVLEKEEEKVISSKIEENKVTITLEENVELALCYDQESNTFYSEYEFSKEMSEEQFEKKFYSIIESPFMGFMAYAEKKNIEYLKYYNYACENGLMIESIGIQMGFEVNKDSNLSMVENLNNFFSEETLEALNYDCEYYLKAFEKKVENENIVLKSSLTLIDEDYSKMVDYIKNKMIFISPETAEIYAKIKVGESYKIPLEGVSGYSSSGGSIKFNDDHSEVIGVKKGVTIGYLYKDDKEYTFYFEVEESDGGNLDGSKSNEEESDDDKPEASKADETKSDDDKPEASKADEGKSDDDKPDAGKTDEGESNDDKPDAGKADEGKTDDDKSEASKTDEAKSDDNNQYDERKIVVENKKDDNDGTVAKDAMLPQTGSKPHILILMTLLCFIILYNVIKMHMYKDI